MSIKIKGTSGLSALASLQTDFQQLAVFSSHSLEERIQSYVRYCNERKQAKEIPKVDYTPSRFSFSCTQCCQRIKCLSNMRFFTREKNNTTIYITNEGSRSVVMTPSAEEGDFSNIERLTNTSFFLHLYESFDDNLEYLFPAALKTLPKRAQEFWENWDPNSDQELDRKKAASLKKVLKEADEVYEQARKEIMKNDLMRRLASPLSKRQGQQTLEATSLSYVPCSRICASEQPEIASNTVSPEAPSGAVCHIQAQPALAVASELFLAEPLTQKLQEQLPERSDTEEVALAASEDVIVPASLDDAAQCAVDFALEDSVERPPSPALSGGSGWSKYGGWSDRVEVAPVNPLSVTVLSRVSALDPLKKYVLKNGGYQEFSKERLTKDLLLVTKCSKSQASEIVQRVEDQIELTITAHDVWEILAELLREKNIRIKGRDTSRVGDGVADLCEERVCESVSDIPHEEFAYLMQSRRKKFGLCLTTPRKTTDARKISSIDIGEQVLEPRPPVQPELRHTFVYTTRITEV